MPVLLEPILPPPLAHDALDLLDIVLQPGQDVPQSSALQDRLVRDIQRLGKRLGQCLRDPRVRLVDAALQRHDVHDGEDPRPLVVIGLDLLEVGEQVRHVGRGVEGRGLRGAEDGVDLAVGEHLRQVLTLLDRSDSDVGGDGVRDLVLALLGGFLDGAGEEFNATDWDAEFFFHDAALPDGGGHWVRMTVSSPVSPVKIWGIGGVF